MKAPSCLSLGVPAKAGLLLLLCFERLLLAQVTPEQLLLKDYKPRSIFKIPETRVEKARYTVIDVHSHDYAPDDAAVERWVQTMNAVGIGKTIILSGASGARLDQIMTKFGKQPERFIVWCGIDYTGFDKPGYGPAAVAELERCHKAGVVGVGELSDKGRGLGSTTNTFGMHIDDPRMDLILDKCAALHMPVNIHVGEDRWMYEPMDETNDGLMNAWKWRIQKGPGVLTHAEVVDSLERAVKKHPGTVFIACHLANCCSDLDRLGAMFDRYPNLYGDIGARYAELSPVPRTVLRFLTRYQDRVLYGTDMTPNPEMYRETFRLLETDDEHFYLTYFHHYHWPMYAWALPDGVLKKIYNENAQRMLSASGTPPR